MSQSRVGKINDKLLFAYDANVDKTHLINSKNEIIKTLEGSYEQIYDAADSLLVLTHDGVLKEIKGDVDFILRTNVKKFLQDANTYLDDTGNYYENGTLVDTGVVDICTRAWITSQECKVKDYLGSHVFPLPPSCIPKFINTHAVIMIDGYAWNFDTRDHSWHQHIQWKYYDEYSCVRIDKDCMIGNEMIPNVRYCAYGMGLTLYVLEGDNTIHCKYGDYTYRKKPIDLKMGQKYSPPPLRVFGKVVKDYIVDSFHDVVGMILPRVPYGGVG